MLIFFNSACRGLFHVKHGLLWVPAQGLADDVCLLSAFGMFNSSPRSALDGASDGLLPSSLPQILVRDALSPSHA